MVTGGPLWMMYMARNRGMQSRNEHASPETAARFEVDVDLMPVRVRGQGEI